MKKLLLAGLATSALIAPAMAADMPVPAAPTVTWTGFYIGANGGWGMSINNSVQSVGSPSQCTDFVTAQDARPEALCVSGDTERIYQDFRFLGDGLDDVPALLFGSGDE